MQYSRLTKKIQGHKRQSIYAIAAGVTLTFSVVPLWAANPNTAVTFQSGGSMSLTSDWSSNATPTSTNDAEFTNSYTPSTPYVDVSLSFGSLDDLNTTAITIGGEVSGGGPAILTLGGGSNSVASSKSDVLYVAPSASLSIIPTVSSQTGVLSVALASGGGNFDVGTGGTLSISSTITGSSSTPLSVTGAGLTTFSGDNSGSFTGQILLSGNLAISSYTNLGASSTATKPSSVAFSGGTLFATANMSSTSTTNAQTWDFTNNGTVNVASGLYVAQLGTLITGSGVLNIASSGTGNTGIFNIGDSSSTFTGTVNVLSGVLAFTSNKFQKAGNVTVASGGQYQINDNATGSYNFSSVSSLTLNGNGPSGSLNPGAFVTTIQSKPANQATTFLNPIILNSNSTIGAYSTLQNSTTPIAYSSTLTLSGVISGAGGLTTVGIAGSGGVGGGTVTLTGKNTYTGGTNVSSGTLFVNNSSGSGTGTQAAVIGNGGTLSGNGTISGSVTVQSGGTIAPGGSAGAVSTLNTGSETWNSGGQYNVTLSTSDPAGNAGTGYGQLVMSGLLNVAASPGTRNTFTINIVSNPSSGSGKAFNGASSYVFPITSGAGLTSFNPAAFVLNTSNFTGNGYTASSNNTSPSGTFSLVAAGGDIDLDYIGGTNAAPEPTSAILFGVTVAPLLLSRRRRQAMDV